MDRQVRERLLEKVKFRSRSEREREQTERLSYSEYEKLNQSPCQNLPGASTRQACIANARFPRVFF
jgi:hypothetical protein